MTIILLELVLCLGLGLCLCVSLKVCLGIGLWIGLPNYLVVGGVCEVAAGSKGGAITRESIIVKGGGASGVDL